MNFPGSPAPSGSFNLISTALATPPTSGPAPSTEGAGGLSGRSLAIPHGSGERSQILSGDPGNSSGTTSDRYTFHQNESPGVGKLVSYCGSELNDFGDLLQQEFQAEWSAKSFLWYGVGAVAKVVGISTEVLGHGVTAATPAAQAAAGYVTPAASAAAGLVGSLVSAVAGTPDADNAQQ